MRLAERQTAGYVDKRHRFAIVFITTELCSIFSPSQLTSSTTRFQRILRRRGRARAATLLCPRLGVENESIIKACLRV